MTEEEYNRFYDALMSAELIATKEFEKEKFLAPSVNGPVARIVISSSGTATTSS